MIHTELQRLTISPGATIRDAMVAIDRGALEVCLITDTEGRLAGITTDGDLRRALLAGAALGDAVLDHATRHPHVVSDGTPRAHVLDLMRALSLTQVPVVDDTGHLVGLHTLSEMVGRATLPNLAVVMAGGRGSRLGRLAQDRPKPLVRVAGRAVIDWVLLNLAGGGIREVAVSVNHLAHMVEDHLGDGSSLGCRIRYLREDPELPLGTAGSLSLVRDSLRETDTPLVVVNGDVMAQFDVADLLEAHARSGAAVTVAMHTYEHDVPFGVLDVDEHGRVRGMGEKPTVRLPVSAGVYALSATALEMVPSDRASTIPDLVDRCLDHDLVVASWAMTSDWIDIGTQADLARARGQQ